MSSGDAFHQRGEALENQFFAKVDQELIEKMKRKADAESLKEALGLPSIDAANALMKAGVTIQSASALRLVPMVLVAWADGTIEMEERDAIIKAAAAHGLDPNGPAGQLLMSLLQSPPAKDLLENWKAYASSLVANLAPEAATELRTTILDEMKKVASAAGGVLGWGAVSSGESSIMKAVEKGLSGK